MRLSSSITVGMSMVTEYDIRRWHRQAYVDVGAFTGASRILEDPNRIFNCDESGFPLDASMYRSIFYHSC
jgi:hypothetical protein